MASSTTAAANITKMVAKTITESLYGQSVFVSGRDPRWPIFARSVRSTMTFYRKRERAVCRPLASAASTVPMSRPW
jgi:hypothetical protein